MSKNKTLKKSIYDESLTLRNIHSHKHMYKNTIRCSIFYHNFFHHKHTTFTLKFFHFSRSIWILHKTSVRINFIDHQNTCFIKWNPCNIEFLVDMISKYINENYVFRAVCIDVVFVVGIMFNINGKWVKGESFFWCSIECRCSIGCNGIARKLYIELLYINFMCRWWWK